MAYERKCDVILRSLSDRYLSGKGNTFYVNKLYIELLNDRKIKDDVKSFDISINILRKDGFIDTDFTEVSREVLIVIMPEGLAFINSSSYMSRHISLSLKRILQVLLIVMTFIVSVATGIVGYFQYQVSYQELSIQKIDKECKQEVERLQNELQAAKANLIPSTSGYSPKDSMSK
jgi:hypothetical protein